MAFTFFFRDMLILELIVKHAVPQLAGRSSVDIWDAGCAMGPEVYSLAIMFAENMGYFAFKNMRIHATDIEENASFKETIISGIYQEEELKRVPEGLLTKYFRPVNGGKQFQVIDMIRDRIIYQRHDLLSLNPIGDNFRLIVCKNVLLHFQQAERIEVIRMFHKSLAPGGYFATEQTQKMPNEIEHLFTKVAPDGEIFVKTGAEG
jgi:chemotaxis protein methyltransferase CheR